MVLDTDALRSLRIAATVTLAIDTIRLRLCAGSSALIEIRRHPACDGTTAALGDDGAHGAIVSPCEFHRQVAQIWSATQRGERIGLRGQDDRPLSVHLGLRCTDRAIAAGLWEFADDTSRVLVVATTASADVVDEIVEQSRATTEDCPTGLVLQVLHDAAVGVALVHTRCDDDVIQRAYAQATMIELLAKCAAEEAAAEWQALAAAS